MLCWAQTEGNAEQPTAGTTFVILCAMLVRLSSVTCLATLVYPNLRVGMRANNGATVDIGGKVGVIADVAILVGSGAVVVE